LKEEEEEKKDGKWKRKRCKNKRNHAMMNK